MKNGKRLTDDSVILHTNSNGTYRLVLQLGLWANFVVYMFHLNSFQESRYCTKLLEIFFVEIVRSLWSFFSDPPLFITFFLCEILTYFFHKPFFRGRKLPKSFPKSENSLRANRQKGREDESFLQISFYQLIYSANTKHVTIKVLPLES